MGLMNILVNYVSGAFHLVTSDELVNVAVYNGFRPKQTSGAVGSAVKQGLITKVDTIKIKGRKINLFQ